MSGSVDNAHITIGVIAGIRPQFIKVAALLNSIRKHNQISDRKIDVVVINTGQHYDDVLSGTLLSELSLSFDHEITHVDLHPDAILANSILKLSNLLKSLNPRPDWIVVFGDGNPAMAGAISAARQGYRVVHIEAGEKRSVSEHEEINRRVVDALSYVHFCVSKPAASFLSQDSNNKHVYWTGDMAYDFTLELVNRLPSNNLTEDKDYILATIHRLENLDESVLKNIILALSEAPRTVYLICHPQTKHKLQEFGLHINYPIYIRDPLTHFEMLAAIRDCGYLITDSGGVIREASHLGKPCIIRRDDGAWPELINSGSNLRVGVNVVELQTAISKMENRIGGIEKTDRNPLYRAGGTELALEILCTLK